jgi:hypothetical protein
VRRAQTLTPRAVAGVEAICASEIDQGMAARSETRSTTVAIAKASRPTESTRAGEGFTVTSRLSASPPRTARAASTNGCTIRCA